MTPALTTLLRGGTRSDRAADHARREECLEAIRDGVEQFSYALGMMIAGHDAPAGSIDPELLARMQHALQPFLMRGDVMRPDFGAFGDLRIEGELLQSADPVLAVLEFDDRCVREAADGGLVPARLRRLRLTMWVELDPVSVIACAVMEVTPRDA